MLGAGRWLCLLSSPHGGGREGRGLVLTRSCFPLALETYRAVWWLGATLGAVWIMMVALASGGPGRHAAEVCRSVNTCLIYEVSVLDPDRVLRP